MAVQASPLQSPRRRSAPPPGVPQLALDENELAHRWHMSVKTLRRWRVELVGPVFCKVGSRVTYLLCDIEAFERRAARFSTSARTAQ